MNPAPIDPPEIHSFLWDGYSGNVGWDIGANCGQTLPEMSKRFQEVHAFEPAEECWPFLTQFSGVNLHKIAISDANMSIDLVALPDKIDTGQLVTGNCEGMEWNPNNPDAQLRRVQARTVDSLVAEGMRTPDFMKIDVEGHEGHVLMGATETLRLNMPDLLIEFHSPILHDTCLTLLSELGYEVAVVRHPHYPAGSHLWHQHGWIRAFA